MLIHTGVKPHVHVDIVDKHLHRKVILSRICLFTSEISELYMYVNCILNNCHHRGNT